MHEGEQLEPAARGSDRWHHDEPDRPFAVFAANGTYTVIVTGTAASPVFTTLNDEFITPTSGSLPTPNATAIGRMSASSYLTVPSGQANIVRLANAGSGGTPQNISVPIADLHPRSLHLTARAARQEDFP